MVTWPRQFGSSQDDTAIGVAVDREGNVYVAGTVDEKHFLSKFDSQGFEWWTIQLGSGVEGTATSLAVDGEGNVYVGGWTWGTLHGQAGEGRRDAFLRKLDPEGLEMWTAQFGSPGDDIAMSVAVDREEDIYVAGVMGRGAFLRKYDSQGLESWSLDLGSAEVVTARDVAVDGAGNVYLAGSALGTLAGQAGHGLGDAFLSKFDPEGVDLWTLQFGTPEEDASTSIVVDAEGSVYVAGLIGEDAFLNKYGSEGTELATISFGSAPADAFLSLAVNGEGNVYATGLTSGAPAPHDVSLSKFNFDGAEVWTLQLGSAEADTALDLALDGQGTIHVVGTTEGALAGQASAGGLDGFVVQVKR